MNADQLQAALNEGLAIEPSKRFLYELHSGRCLIGFDSRPDLYVVAPPDTEPKVLAILILEQLAIIHAQNAAFEAALSIQRLQDLPPSGGIQ